MYIELHAASAFSFLDGATLPEALIERAAALDYPALALLDRRDPLGGPALLGYAAPLVAAGAVAVAALVWRVGVRHYRSTGS